MTSEQIQMLQAGRFEDLIKLFTSEIEKDPNNFQVRFDLATTLSHSGRYYDALNIFKMILSEKPEDESALVNQGLAQLRLNKYDDAVESLTRVLHIGKRKNVEPSILSLAHTNLGVVYEERADFDLAVHHYTVAIALYEGNSMAPRYLNELREMGDVDHGLFRTVILPNGKERHDLWYFQEPSADLSNQEVVLQAGLISLRDKTSEGQLIEAVSIPWFAIIRELERDPAFLFKVPWRKMEEIIAGAYEAAGWSDVILTPSSGDGGRDVIATKTDFGSVCIYDQVKAFAPNRPVTANDVRALLGVLSTKPNVSKGVITTSSIFAPGIYQEMKDLIPYRIELRDGASLAKWLSSIAKSALVGSREKTSYLSRLLERRNT